MDEHENGFYCPHCNHKIFDSSATEWYKGKQLSLPQLARDLEEAKEELARYKKLEAEGKILDENTNPESPSGLTPAKTIVFAAIIVAAAILGRYMIHIGGA